jgi:hypothetical protein
VADQDEGLGCRGSAGRRVRGLDTGLTASGDSGVSKWLSKNADLISWGIGVAAVVLTIVAAICAFYKADRAAMWLSIFSGILGFWGIALSVVSTRERDRELAALRESTDMSAYLSTVALGGGHGLTPPGF